MVELVNELEGKVAIVTGSARNIGRVTAEELARAGASLVINALQAQDLCNEVAESIRDNGGKAIAMYNPMIISSSVENLMMKEGCLTYPFLFLNIKRPRKCVFKYEDSEGKLQEAHLDGMMSRICQHEYDHILGRNFVEHVSKFKLKRAEEKAKKLIQQMKKSQA